MTTKTDPKVNPKPAASDDFNPQPEIELTGNGQPERSEAPDPFDPASLWLDPAAEQIPIDKPVVIVPVRKPNPQGFFQVHPGPSYRVDTRVIDFKEEHEVYILTPEMRAALIYETKPVRIYTCIHRTGGVFLWPVGLPGPDGRHNQWHDAAHAAAKLAMGKWTRLRTLPGASEYDISTAGGQLAEPDWPKVPFGELIKIAFREHLISDPDHPVMRRLRGLT